MGGHKTQPLNDSDTPPLPPKVVYVSDSTIMDIDLGTMKPFDNWEEADQFMIDMSQAEDTGRWLIGIRAGQLPKEDHERNFTAWCRRARRSPGRVAVWRRMAELYDLDHEVKRFPELSHKHWEVMMGRAAKAKRAKEAGDDGLYEELMTDLQDANDGHESSEAMLARIAKRDNPNRDQRDVPAKLRGTTMFRDVEIDGSVVPCLLLIPNATDINLWYRILEERSITDHDVLDVVLTRFDTE